MLPAHRMELRHLRYFQVVAETLSFSRASERLRVAQPTISRQIAALEQELDTKLFVRTTTRVRLTDAGKHLKHEVDHLLTQLAIAVTGAQEIARGRAGELNLGSDWRLLLPQIPEAALRHRKKHPRVSINFVELSVHQQIEALRDGRIHLGFVHKNAIGPRDDLGMQQIYTADMRIALSASHPLANATSIPLRDLKTETWLRLDEKNHPGFRTLMLQLCHPALFTPRFGRISYSFEGMLALAAMGDGICLVPTNLITQTHPGLRFIPTDCPPFEFYAVWLKESPAGPRTAFLKFLRQSLTATKPSRNIRVIG